jgi:hypothetical protein
MLPLIHIHIGKTLPSYFWDTIRQARRFFSGKIFVVGPGDIPHPPESIELGCTYIAYEQFTHCHKISELNSVSFLTKYTKDNFWHFAMMRLFILEEFMIRNTINTCIHCENDVTIYHDPAIFENVFAAHYKNSIAVTPLGPTDGCTAAYMYVGSVAALGKVTEEMLLLLPLGEKKLRPMTGCPMVNEMMLLGIIQRRHPEIIKSLPVMPFDPVSSPWLKRRPKPIFRPFAKFLDLILPRNYPSLPPWGVRANVSSFQSVFDAASWGQFAGKTMTGGSTANAYTHHYAGPDILAGRYTITWHKDDKNRMCPFIKQLYGDFAEWKLNNLHVHSKLIKDVT